MGVKLEPFGPPVKAISPSLVATMSPGRNVGSSATGVVTRPKASLPLQVQPGTILLRYAKAVASSE